VRVYEPRILVEGFVDRYWIETVTVCGIIQNWIKSVLTKHCCTKYKQFSSTFLTILCV